MKEVTYTILALAAIYLFVAAFLYVYQRKMIYFPTSLDPHFNAEEVVIDNAGTHLRGWVLHPGKAHAVIYFGGNSELITHREAYFNSQIPEHSVYLINYRGYGNSDGKPSEAALFADALAIYDAIRSQHARVSAYGRSLGSGVAVYLAANRPLDRLILLTPYDSITEVAARHYPLFPVRYLLQDRFDSASLAERIDIPVLVASAELDRVIPLEHTLALRERLSRAQLSYVHVAGAAHNDIPEFEDYRAAVRRFMAEH